MAEKPTLTNHDLLKLDQGLRALDGVANEAGKIVRFDFDDGISWDIARDQDAVERALGPYNKVLAALQAKHGVIDGMAVTEKNAPAVALFAEERNMLLEKTVEVNGIIRLSRKALQDAGVKIPGVFKNLMPILNDA